MTQIKISNILNGQFRGIKESKQRVLSRGSRQRRGSAGQAIPAESGIQDLTPDDTVNIFLPTTPNPTSGFLLFLPRKATQTLTMTVEEGIKMVVSGGIVTPPDPEEQKSLTDDSARQQPLAKSG